MFTLFYPSFYWNDEIGSEFFIIYSWWKNPFGIVLLRNSFIERFLSIKLDLDNLILIGFHLISIQFTWLKSLQFFSLILIFLRHRFFLFGKSSQVLYLSQFVDKRNLFETCSVINSLILLLLNLKEVWKKLKKTRLLLLTI